MVETFSLTVPPDLRFFEEVSELILEIDLVQSNIKNQQKISVSIDPTF